RRTAVSLAVRAAGAFSALKRHWAVKRPVRLQMGVKRLRIEAAVQPLLADRKPIRSRRSARADKTGAGASGGGSCQCGHPDCQKSR
ncbi:MAG: hypothetical protein ACXWVP_00430, partial [Burkholderiales bacterium]